MSRMGDLAATDVYNAFDVPGEQSTNVPGAILNAGNWFLRQAAKPEAEAQADVRNVMSALAAPVMVPGQMMKPNPYPPGSEEAAFYDASKLQTATQWGPEMALNMVGSGAPFAEAGAVGTSGGKGIHAYHSSPHDFDKFDLAKIGTGEGAQAYGHGLYFAESPAVSGQGGQYWNQFKGRALGEDPAAHKAMEYLQSYGFDRQAAAEGIDKFLKHGINKDNARAVAEHTAARDLLASGGKVGPRTYEVNINADPAHMLDWDKPLAEMSQPVKDALRDTWMAHPEGHSQQTGSQIYKINERQMATGGRGLAYKMNEAGIPGIKYLDQGSRGKGTGSSNYVIFNPELIDILKKYGIAGVAPTAMGALAAQDQYQGER